MPSAGRNSTQTKRSLAMGAGRARAWHSGHLLTTFIPSWITTKTSRTPFVTAQRAPASPRARGTWTSRGMLWVWAQAQAPRALSRPRQTSTTRTSPQLLNNNRSHNTHNSTQRLQTGTDLYRPTRLTQLEMSKPLSSSVTATSATKIFN